MIDTIKFYVPIEDTELFERIKSNSIQFKKEDLKTGEVEFAFYTNEVQIGSYSRKVAIKITDNNYARGLFIELSLPKYAKGNNVEMIFPSELPDIVSSLYFDVCRCLHTLLPDVSLWQIYRLDVCYNWIFRDQAEARSVIGFIQRIDFPRKKKYLYDTSVMYVGSAYTLKFYLKGSEFKKNEFYDMKQTNEEEAVELHSFADRMVRFEIGLKKEYLEEFFSHKKVLLEHIIDDHKIEESLSFFLKDKILRYITKENTTDSQIRDVLYTHFSKKKALRLYQFHKEYYQESGVIKSMMLEGGLSRATVWRNKKDLKNAGVGFDLADSSGVSLLEQLVIPSPHVRFDLLIEVRKKREEEDRKRAEEDKRWEEGVNQKVV